MKFLIANTKGGVGKSTLATNLAAWLAAKGRVLLVDADPQASTASWASWRDEAGEGTPKPTTIMLKGDSVYKQIKRMEPEYDHVVIDAGGRDSEEMRYAMAITDKLIIPISNSGFDAAAWSDMEKIIQMAKPNNPGLQIRVVLTRIHSSRKPPIELEKFLVSKGFQLLDTIIYERAAIVSASEEGLSVIEHNPSSKAALDVVKFCREAFEEWQ